MQRVLSIIPSALFSVALVITPFLFIPGLLDSRELPKQIFILVLAAISALSAVAIVQKQRSFSLNKGYLLLVITTLSFLISSLLSKYSFASFVGQGRSEYIAFLTIVAIGLLIIAASQSKHLSARWYLLQLSAPGIIGAIAIVLHYVGLLESFAFMGSSSQFFLLMVVVALPVTTYLFSQKSKLYERSVAIATIATIFSALVAFDSSALLALFGVSQLILVILITKKQAVSSLALTSILFVSLLSLVIIPFPTSVDSLFTVDVVPSMRSSSLIAKESLSGARALFGTGPGTFGIQYMQYQDTGIAQTSFWSLVFDRSTNFATTLAVSGGFVTLIALLAYVGFSLFQALKQRNMTVGLMIATLGAGMFLFPFNLTLVLWLFLLSGLVLSDMKMKSVKLDQTSSVIMGVIVLLIVSLGLGLGAAKVAAQSAFVRGLSAYTNNETSLGLERINAASRLNRQSDVLHRNLASALILRLPSVIQSDSADAEKERFVRALLSSAQRAVEASPESAKNYALLGQAYAEVSPIVDNALTLAANAYDRAAELFPSNPNYFVKASEMRLALFDQSGQQEFETDEEAANFEEIRSRVYNEANEAVDAALELRPGYPQALLQRARLLERSENPAEAIEIYTALTGAYPQDTGLGLQYSLALLRQGENEMAINELERITRISPEFSNAYWYLSAAYELEGDLAAAESALQSILAYDPENETVISRMNELQGRLAAPELPEPLEGLEEPSEDLSVLEEESVGASQ